MMNRDELLEKYGKTILEFSYYYKHQFTYVGPFKRFEFWKSRGNVTQINVLTSILGGSGHIYRSDMKARMSLKDIEDEIGVELVKINGKYIYEQKY